jgi:hypothetical protein
MNMAIKGENIRTANIPVQEPKTRVVPSLTGTRPQAKTQIPVHLPYQYHINTVCIGIYRFFMYYFYYTVATCTVD